MIPTPDSSPAHPGHPVLIDVALGLAAGLAATQVTNWAQTPLKRITPERVHRHERRVRPGATSSLVAARTVAGALDLSPSRREEALCGTAIHFATGMAWGPVYALLRRYGGLQPIPAALVSGGAMSLILDEILVPALGLSAPCDRYPAFTRVRGVAAHLVYGAAAALAAEGLGRFAGHPPGRSGKPRPAGTVGPRQDRG